MGISMRIARWLGCLLVVAGLLVGCAGGDSRHESISLNSPTAAAPWQFGPIKGQALSTAHYAIFTTTANPSIRGNLGGFMEAARTHYAALTGLPEPARKDEPWTIYLLATRPEWAALTQKITGEQAPIYLSVENGGYCFAGVCVFWDITPLATYGVASHEGMHQFLHHRTRQSLPSWAEEGLASLCEGFSMQQHSVRFTPERNILRYNSLRSAILSGRWRTTTQLLNMDAAENVRGPMGHTGEYYAQLWAMLLLIHSEPQYNAGLRRMVADAVAGRLDKELEFDARAWVRLQRNARLYNQTLSPRAFAHYIDADTARFEQRYRQFARELVGLAKR